MSVQNDVAIVDAKDYQESTVNAAIDKMFAYLGLDPGNPFAGIIQPGMRVFIKPNWVASRWRTSCGHKGSIYSVITHPSVIEAVADRAAKALNGRGELLIGDNPSIDADFDELMELTQIRRLETKYSVPCKILDLRPLICTNLNDYGKREKMIAQHGDPMGEVAVNLGQKSLLYSMDSSLFRGIFDERDETIAAHSKENQWYSFARSIYDADVYISVPKLKTHQKVGVTLNLKGLVGAVTQKKQLVHWRIGTPETGGDEYPDTENLRAAQSAKVTHRGAWPGNDTIWRMVVDLYQGFLKKPNRTCFSIIDGILAGEGQGPFCPTEKYAAVLIGGSNLLYTDIAAARYMGIDPDQIRYLAYFMDRDNIHLNQDISVSVNGNMDKNFFYADTRYKNFRVIEQWKNIKYGYHNTLVGAVYGTGQEVE